MAIQKTEAIVLKAQPFRSTSLILTLFTKSFGKIRGIVKGVRQEGQLQSAVYEIFTCLDIVFYEKTRSDLHLISEASMLESHQNARSSLGAIAYGSYFCELADQLSEVHDPHEKIYDLLKFSFRYLSTLPGYRVARLFEIKILNEIGWLPYLDKCLSCGREPLEQGFFSARQGALLCPSCAPKVADTRPLEREPLAVMRYYSGHDLEESIRLGISRAAEKNLEVFMDRFFQDRLNRTLASRLFLEKIKAALQTA